MIHATSFPSPAPIKAAPRLSICNHPDGSILIRCLTGTVLSDSVYHGWCALLIVCLTGAVLSDSVSHWCVSLIACLTGTALSMACLIGVSHWWCALLVVRNYEKRGREGTSGMPGDPRGPSYRITKPEPFFKSPWIIAANAACSPSDKALLTI